MGVVERKDLMLRVKMHQNRILLAMKKNLRILPSVGWGAGEKRGEVSDERARSLRFAFPYHRCYGKIWAGWGSWVERILVLILRSPDCLLQQENPG